MTPLEYYHFFISVFAKLCQQLCQQNHLTFWLIEPERKGFIELNIYNSLDFSLIY